MNRLLLFSLVVSASALAKDVVLDEGQAIVIAASDEHTLVFKEVQGETKFKKKGGKLHRYRPTVVKPGCYYISSIKFYFDNWKPIEFNEPKNKESCFEIREGSVNYLGEWDIDTRAKARDYDRLSWDVVRDYSPKPIKTIKKRNPELMQYPLVVSNEEGKVMVVSWSDF